MNINTRNISIHTLSSTKIQLKKLHMLVPKKEQKLLTLLEPFSKLSTFVHTKEDMQRLNQQYEEENEELCPELKLKSARLKETYMNDEEYEDQFYKSVDQLLYKLGSQHEQQEKNEFTRRKTLLKQVSSRDEKDMNKVIKQYQSSMKKTKIQQKSKLQHLREMEMQFKQQSNAYIARLSKRMIQLSDSPKKTQVTTAADTPQNAVITLKKSPSIIMDAGFHKKSKTEHTVKFSTPQQSSHFMPIIKRQTMQNQFARFLDQIDHTHKQFTQETLEVQEKLSSFRGTHHPTQQTHPDYLMNDFKFLKRRG